jgi:hypothetical protein
VTPGTPEWPTRLTLPNGEPIDESDEAWPKRPGIRYTVTLQDESAVLEVRECEYEDIPCGWNRNSLSPYSPYARGTPARIDPLCQLANRLMHYMALIVEANPYPCEIQPQSLADALERAGAPSFQAPNTKIVINDPAWERWMSDRDRLGFATDPPQISESMIRLLQLVLELIDDEGQQAAVLQGQMPTGSSGALADRLTANARGPLAFKSRFTEWSLQRVARIALHAMLKFWPEDDKVGLAPYPAVVATILRTEIRNLQWDIDVELVSGRGASKQQTQSQAVEKAKMGAISMRTLQERLDEDPDLETRRLREEQAPQAPMPNGMAMPLSAAPPGMVPGAA